MRIFLDANIVFSASQKGSLMDQFLSRLALHATLVTHPYPLHEAQRNLASKRPQWLRHHGFLLKNILIMDHMEQVKGVKLPDKDLPILYASIGSRCTHLLTGDVRHFQHLFGKEIHGVKIVSPQLLAEEAQKLNWL